MKKILILLILLVLTGCTDGLTGGRELTFEG